MVRRVLKVKFVYNKSKRFFELKPSISLTTVIMYN